MDLPCIGPQLYPSGAELLEKVESILQITPSSYGDRLGIRRASAIIDLRSQGANCWIIEN